MPPKDKIIEPINDTFDNVAMTMINPANAITIANSPQSPFAKWPGQIDLGGDLLDVYVLDTKQRVISLRGTIKAIANTDSGNLGSYIGAATLKPFIDSDKIAGELIEFSIPGALIAEGASSHGGYYFIGEYVRGGAHTNTIEGYFSIFKRGMTGVYQHCNEKHLKRYLAEFDFRYNEREALGINDADRMTIALQGITGKRLTYRD